MLTYLHTSVLDSDAQTVVNTVNTDGVMGKGLAKEFKRRYPEMYRRYRELCKTGGFKVGQLWLWKGNGQWVLNIPTKTTWRRPSEVAYVEAGLRKFADTYEERGITEISFPRLGCGNGGLDWETQVRPIMEQYLSPLPIPVYIHDYHADLGLPEHQEAREAGYNRSYESFVDTGWKR
jgi:O-acetyl-ADP-ribose deacetylase (regulator of RNase III)